jgi:DHA1 family multidrug resistance protein-like MFS transporter
MLPVGLGMALSLFGDLTLFAVLVTQLDRLGLTLAQAGILLSLHRLVRIVFNPLSGWIQDRIGRRVPFLAGLVLAVGSTAAYGLVSGFWPFLIARVAWGAAWALINVGGLAMALDLSNGSDRGRLTGIYNTWMWVGYGAGPVVGSLLTDQFGFRPAMLACALISAIGLAAAFFLLPETHRPVERHLEQVTSTGNRQPLRLGGWTLKGMFLYGVNQFAVDGIILSTVTLLISLRVGEQFSLFGFAFGAASAGGVIMAARSALAALLSPLIGRFSDGKRGRVPVIAGGLALGAAGFVLLALAGSLLPILMGVLIGALSASILLVVIPAMVGDEAPGAQRAQAAGLMVAAGDIGSTIGPFLALSLAPVIGLQPIYLLCASLFGVGLLLVWRRRNSGSEVASAEI